MKMRLDCISCVIGSVLHLAKESVSDPVQQEKLTREVLDISAGVSWELTPPEYAGSLYRTLNKYNGDQDLFAEAKQMSTQLALSLLPDLREELSKQEDYFNAVTRLVIGGNIIDYGVDRHFKLETVRNHLFEVFQMPLAAEAVQMLRTQMEKAGKILYILDNCGEAVLDLLLLEMFSDKITLAVRGYPILNDMTEADLVPSGLGAFPFISTGDATPGVSLAYASPEFLQTMQAADLVIAKGQGNFETLTDYHRPIIHLLRAKCAIVCKFLDGAPHNSLQVIGRNLKEC